MFYHPLQFLYVYLIYGINPENLLENGGSFESGTSFYGGIVFQVIKCR